LNIDWNAYNNRISSAILDTDGLDDLLLSQLGCSLERFPGGRIYRGPCPVHGGDGKNFVLRTDGESVPVNWKCYSQHCEDVYKPSLLGLVRGVLSFQEGRKVHLREAVNYLKEFVNTFGVKVRRPSLKLTVPSATPRPPTWTREEVRQRLVIPSPYFVGRGFAPAVLDQMDVGHSPKLGRSVVPFYDDNGQTCVGYAARWEGPACPRCSLCHEQWEACGQHDHRWRVSEGFPKSAYLYNYAATRQAEAPFVVVVEGPGGVFRLREAQCSAVACLGSELTGQQAEKLAALSRKVIVALDNDEAGRAGARRAMSRLREYRVDALPLLLPPSVKDVAEMRATDVLVWLYKSAGLRLALAAEQTSDIEMSACAA
jgi:hypothetical protein